MTSCPICGLEASLRIPARQDPKFSVVRCGGCGHGWTEPFVPESEIGAYYPPSYYGDDNVRFNPVMEALVRVFRRRRAAVIARLARKGRVLDVGCGRGFMLATLRARGFEVEGAELNETAARHARATLGISVHVGSLLDGPHSAGAYEVVIFWHSLEHFADPLAAIARARTLLAPGGFLVIAVPNSDSIEASLFGGDWFHLDVPRHYAHFGTRSLRLALEREGFAPRTISHFSLEQNPYGALQSLYNACGFEFNWLYTLLKTRSARPADVPSRPLQTALVVLLLPLFGTLAFGLWALQLVLRRGATIVVYAEKLEPHQASALK